MNEAMGSEPGERTKTRGVELSESEKQAGRLKVGGSMNLCPIFSTTKFEIADVILSGLTHFNRSIFWNEFSLEFQSPGMGSS